MKRYLIVVLCVLWLNSNAQNDTIKKVKFGISFSGILAYPEGPYLCPNAVFYFNKRHALFIGPMFWIDKFSSLNIPSNKFLENIGIIGGYKYYPNFKHKVLSIYLENITTLFSYKSYIDCSSFYGICGDIRYNFLQSTIGYGVRLKIFRNLYLNHSMGYGLWVIWIKEIKSNNIASALDSDRLIKFSIGYDF